MQRNTVDYIPTEDPVYKQISLYPDGSSWYKRSGPAVHVMAQYRFEPTPNQGASKPDADAIGWSQGKSIREDAHPAKAGSTQRDHTAWRGLLQKK